MTSQRDMVQRAELAQRGNRDGSPRRRTTVEPRRADDRESLEKIERILVECKREWPAKYQPYGVVPADLLNAAIVEIRDMLGREQ